MPPLACGSTVAFLLFGPGRTVTLAVLVVAAFSGGAWAVWRHVEKHVEGSPDYLVSVEQITITPQPEWVRSDVRAEAFRTASPPDRPLSSLDDGLAQRIYMAFMLHPWVAKATVTKRAGARVERRYRLSPAGLHGGGCQRHRRSICCRSMAKACGCPARTSRRSRRSRIPAWPASIAGRSSPWGIPGAMPAVVDGAAIAAALLPVWQQLKLYRIQPAAQASSPGGPQGRPTSFTRVRARGSSGAVQPAAPPRANRPRKKGGPARAVCGGPRKSRRRTAAGCPQDPAGRSSEADERASLTTGLLASGEALNVRGGRRQFAAGGKFFAENGKVVRGFDANANNARRNANHRDGDLIPNQDSFPRFSR